MKLDKKNRLISAAIEAFNEKGLEQTKIADIVKIAGVAQGTYYLYFPSKLAIMPAIAEVVVEKYCGVASRNGFNFTLFRTIKSID